MELISSKKPVFTGFLRIFVQFLVMGRKYLQLIPYRRYNLCFQTLFSHTWGEKNIYDFSILTAIGDCQQTNLFDIFCI